MLNTATYPTHQDVLVEWRQCVSHGSLYGLNIDYGQMVAESKFLWYLPCSPTISHEPNSLCLVSMVADFMEDELVVKAVCGRARCNCERGLCMENVGKRASDDIEDDDGSSVGELSSILQVLVLFRVRMQQGSMLRMR